MWPFLVFIQRLQHFDTRASVSFWWLIENNLRKLTGTFLNVFRKA